MLTQLDKERAALVRSATTRASYMSINRVDVQYATKELARFMSEPNEGACNMLERLIRYFVGHGRLVHAISEQRYVKAPRVGTDIDYARCVLTRKSTRGTHLFHGVNSLKDRSWTQGAWSLSVAESEFFAGVRGASILLGAKSMMIDFGEDAWQCVGYGQQFGQAYHGTTWSRTDQASTLPYVVASRTCGHRQFRTEKRKGKHNTADIGTKVVSAEVLRRLLKTLKMEWCEGRHPPALRAELLRLEQDCESGLQRLQE